MHLFRILFILELDKLFSTAFAVVVAVVVAAAAAM